MAKKKQKCAEKPKDFVNTPFRGLRTIVAETELAPVKKVTAEKTPEPVREDVDDRELFLRAVQGVEKPKAHSSGKGPSDKPVAVAEPRIKEEDRQLFLSSLRGMDTTFQDEYPDDESLRPLAVNRMRQLKNGAIRIDLELDLHGLSRDEALASLSRFVTGAYNRGQKAILVITGKGNNSPGEPVLQSSVASWLRESGKKMVAEFAPAPRQMGGSGAFVVFLKENKDRSK